jgi:hypothetical protein
MAKGRGNVGKRNRTFQYILIRKCIYSMYMVTMIVRLSTARVGVVALVFLLYSGSIVGGYYQAFAHSIHPVKKKLPHTSVGN